MTNQRLKEVTAELNKTTSSDIVGVGYGFKTVNGKSTSDRTIVFTVIRKKPLSEIPEEERIPSEITIDGETFSTDVIEGTITPFAYGYCDPSFYNWQGTPPSNRNTHRPLMGGISVTNHTALGAYVGTMGFIAVDNDTNTLVGVSNNHVLSDDAFYTSDRDPLKPRTNVFDHSCIQPNELGNSDPLNEIGKVKRYEPISPIPFNNEVDGALISLQPLDKQNPQQGTIDPAVSWIQHGITGMTSAPRFATTQELDSIFENPAQEYYTAGRTTGAKGQGVTKLFCTANSTSIAINYSRQGLDTTCYMNDTFELQASGLTTPTGDWCYYPSAGGDSGSAILTQIEGEFVIVGLLYGGRQIPDPDNPEQYLPITTLCNRIDNVASALNISAWDGNFQNYTANAPQVYIHQGLSTDKFKIVNGVKHYQLGLVSNSTHPFDPTPQPTATAEPTPTGTPLPSPTPTPTAVPFSCYVAGPLTADNSNGAVFDRSINVNGVLEVIAGAVGGNVAVPDEFSKKVARSFQLIMDPSATGITLSYQNNLIATLRGDEGTIHEGIPTAQRVGYGNGDAYDPNWLTDQGITGYTGYQEFLDTHATNDMVWYSSGSTSGDTVIEEVFEHIFHTVHLFGIMGAVPGSSTAVNWMAEQNPNWQTTDLHLAMKQAIDNSMFDPSEYAPNWSSDTEHAELAYKEYMYLLNWGMWEMSEFWAGGSLSPEWNDNMRTPSGIQINNILGYNLFNSYFAPVLTKPSFVTLRNIFQDNHGGVSGYVADDCITPTPTPTARPEPTGVIDPTPTATEVPPTGTPSPTSTPAPQTFYLNYDHLNSCSTANLILSINGVQHGSPINLSQGSTSSGTLRGPITVYPGDQISLQYKPFNLISPCTLSYQNPTVEVFLNGVSVGTNSNDSVYSTYNYTVQSGVNPTLLVEMNSFSAPTPTPVPTYTLTLQDVTSETYAHGCAKGYITVEKNGSVVATLTKTQGDTTASWVDPTAEDTSSISFTSSDVVTMKSYSQGGGGSGCATTDTTVRCVYNGSAKTSSSLNTGTNGQSFTIPDENGTAFGWFFEVGGI